VAGRVRRKLLAARGLGFPRERPALTCALCARPLPAAQADAHHLIPRSEGGKETVPLHRICHRQIHALFSETELARDYHSIAALQAHPGMAAFLSWIASKPPEFSGRTRKSQRLR